MHSLKIFLPLFVAVLCLPACGQTVDTAVVGTVSDNSGAVIAGATVTVSSPSTGIEKKAVTKSTGEYSFTYLTPGTYDITVAANGFISFEQTGIVLAD
jgi:protocatechuate 3,4-dioxygenase beta subunit